MPIVEIKQSADGPIMVKICQNCKHMDEIQVNALTLGNVHMAEAIELPSCPKCPSKEMLVRSTDASVPDRLSAHRKVVNAVSNHLQSLGKVNDAAAPGIKLAPAAPVGELYGSVRHRVSAPARADSPMKLAMDALKAAQAAVAAAQAAQAQPAAPEAPAKPPKKK